MHLSRNFTLRELIHSETAERNGLDNDPGAREIAFLQELALHVLQPARDHMGMPLSVRSGYRNETLNTLVRGSRTSDHKQGMAADIVTVPYSLENMRKLGKFIEENLEFKQLIWEYGGKWIHVSYHHGHNRGEVLEAVYNKEEKRTEYPSFSFLGDDHAQ